jgi:glycosyltransferase involved in cell wall biosynthesis
MERPRVVATHFALYAAPLLPLPSGVAHVVHFHGPWAGEAAAEGAAGPVVAAKAFLERRVYASARRCIVLSEAFAALLEERYGVERRAIAVIPGGVDTARFAPCSRAEARRRLGWPEGAAIIFCVRRMVRRMGLEDLLGAFAKVAARQPRAVLVLGGRGPLAGELRARAALFGLSERVLFPGFLPEEQLPLAYAAADFTVVPSRALEGFGLVTLESLACGTPVLVTPVGGLPEAVAGLDPALVLPGCGAEALAEGLARGLDGALPSPDRCRAYAQDRFAWPLIARRVLEVYAEAAA